MVQSDFQSAFFAYYIVNSFQCPRVNEYTYAYAVERKGSMLTAPDFPNEPVSTLVNCIYRYLLNFILKMYVRVHACVSVCVCMWPCLKPW